MGLEISKKIWSQRNGRKMSIAGRRNDNIYNNIYLFMFFTFNICTHGSKSNINKE